MKVCASCKKEKQDAEFYRRSGQGYRRKDGTIKHYPRSECRVCYRDRLNAFVAGKRVEYTDRWRNQSLKTRYGITTKEYERMLKAQNGLCAMCNKPPDARYLCVDHDHSTGMVRSLIHMRCNVAIGWVEKNDHLLDLARQYLSRWGVS